MPDPKSLPDEAAAVITALLPVGAPGREELLRQVPHARVVRRCGCGCVTVDLDVNRAAVPPAPVEDGEVASGSFTLPGELGAAGVMLLAVDGYLSCLEAYSTADTPVTAWPAPEALAVE